MCRYAWTCVDLSYVDIDIDMRRYVVQAHDKTTKCHYQSSRTTLCRHRSLRITMCRFVPLRIAMCHGAYVLPAREDRPAPHAARGDAHASGLVTLLAARVLVASMNAPGGVDIYIYIHIYIHAYTYICIRIYIYKCVRSVWCGPL